MDFLWPILGLVLLWWSLKYSLTFAYLIKSRFSYLNGSIVNEDRVPIYISTLLAISVDRLHQLGFRDCDYLEISPFVLRHPLVRWEKLLCDPSGTHFATVALRYPVTPQDPFSVSFYTWFDDGHLLLTLDRSAHGIIDRIPNATLRDCRFNNLERQWVDHQQEFNEITDRTVVNNLDSAKFLDYYINCFRDYFDRLVQQNIFIAEPNNAELKFGIRGALRHTHQLILNSPKPQPSLVAVVLPLEIVIDNTKMLETNDRKPFKRSTKFWLFLISTIAFVVLTFPTIGWKFGIQIIAIILIHELGHLLAMQFFGYRDTGILFIPLLGGVATGKKEDASLTQKFWVLMLGPLPGLILGTIIALSAFQHDIHRFGLLTIGINLLNLFPIYPLDGGKIVDLLVQKYPYLGFVLKTICIAISIVLGLTVMSIFLGIAGILIISLRFELLTARSIDKLRGCESPVDLERDDWFQWAASQLDPKSLSALKPSQQKLFVTRLWDWHLDRHNSTLSRLCLGIIYGLSVTFGIFGTFTSITSHTARSINPEIYLKRGDLKYQAGDFKGAIADYDLALKIDPSHSLAYQKRGLAKYHFGDKQGVIADYNQASKLKYQNASPWYEQAVLADRRGDIMSAMINYGEAIRIDPNHAEAYLNRSALKYKLGDEIGGYADYNRAIKLNPNLRNRRNTATSRAQF